MRGYIKRAIQLAKDAHYLCKEHDLAHHGVSLLPRGDRFGVRLRAYQPVEPSFAEEMQALCRRSHILCQLRYAPGEKIWTYELTFAEEYP